MTTRIGINGFGRIGRQVLRAVREYHPNDLEVVAFNDLGDLKTMAHLLKYDTNYGRFEGAVEIQDDCLVVDGKEIKAFKETDPAAIPWGNLGVDIVKVFAAWPGVINDEEAIAMYAPYERGNHYKRLYPPELRKWQRAIDGIREVADWADVLRVPFTGTGAVVA